MALNGIGQNYDPMALSNRLFSTIPISKAEIVSVSRYSNRTRNAGYMDIRAENGIFKVTVMLQQREIHKNSRTEGGRN